MTVWMECSSFQTQKEIESLWLSVFLTLAQIAALQSLMGGCTRLLRLRQGVPLTIGLDVAVETREDKLGLYCVGEDIGSGA